MSKLVMKGMDLSNVKNIRQDSSREHIEIEFRDGSIERFKRSNKIVCPKCGFEGESSDYDVAVKQQKKEFANVIGIGYQCRKCGTEFGCE